MGTDGQYARDAHKHALRAASVLAPALDLVFDETEFAQIT